MKKRGQDIASHVALIVTAMQGGPAPVSTEKLATLIGSVAASLRHVAQTQGEVASKQLVPAVPVHKSIGEDYIVCLEDGKKLKMLKRYINSRFGLSPEQYRRKWGLATDYPMTAPSHSKRRSTLAKENRLGYSRMSRAAQQAAL